MHIFVGFTGARCSAIGMYWPDVKICHAEVRHKTPPDLAGHPLVYGSPNNCTNRRYGSADNRTNRTNTDWMYGSLSGCKRDRTACPQWRSDMVGRVGKVQGPHESRGPPSPGGPREFGIDKMPCPRSSFNYNYWTISVEVGMLYSNFGLIITENRDLAS